MLVLFITVFLDLVGFGLVIPLSPHLAQLYEATPLQVGILMAVYSLAQFLFAPLWGGISDRYGRRPVLLLSLFGASLGHWLFAYSTSLVGLYVARFIAGFFGANISTAMAAMTDLSGPEKRTRAMGLIGAAFGLGFILGPVIGAFGGEFGKTLGDQPPFGHHFPAWIAGILTFLNAFSALFFLKETLPLSLRKKSLKIQGGRLRRVFNHLSRPLLGPLQGLYLLYSFALSFMEASLFLYVKDVYELGFYEAGLGFAYMGVILALTQGVIIRFITKKWTDFKILKLSILLMSFSFFILIFLPPFFLFVIAVTLMALGSGLLSPVLSSLISRVSADSERGQVFGVNQSLAALARILGPLGGGAVYGFYRGFPFILSLLSIGLILWIFLRIRVALNLKLQNLKGEQSTHNHEGVRV